MYQVKEESRMIFDADAHLEESAETFQALSGNPQFADAAPRVLEGQKRAFWLIEGKTYPKLTGRGVFTFGTPHLQKAEYVDPERRTRIGSQELTDPSYRLADMDQEGIDTSVVFPSLFLVYPLAENALFMRALCRTYNQWVAAKCAQTLGRIHWIAIVPLPDVSGAVEELTR